MFRNKNTLQGLTLAAALALAIGALSGGWERAAFANHPKALFDDPAAPVSGNPSGDVTLVEFFDYHCGPCKGALKAVMPVLDDDPGVRLVFKEFPVLGRQSIVAARAALAVNEQEPSKYVEFHSALMSSRGRLTERRILRIARDVGLDAERLKADMFSPEIENALRRNYAVARALGIRGTPAFVVGERLIPGAASVETLKNSIAQARRTQAGSSVPVPAVAANGQAAPAPTIASITAWK